MAVKALAGTSATASLNAQWMRIRQLRDSKSEDYSDEGFCFCSRCCREARKVAPPTLPSGSLADIFSMCALSTQLLVYLCGCRDGTSKGDMPVVSLHAWKGSLHNSSILSHSMKYLIDDDNSVPWSHFLLHSELSSHRMDLNHSNFNPVPSDIKMRHSG